MIDELDVLKNAAPLLNTAGICSKSVKSIVRINGGGNNQIYLIEQLEKRIILKKYYHNHHDGRNRLKSEYEFLDIAYAATPNSVPKTYAKDFEKQIALYEYIPGRKINNPLELRQEFIELSAHFIASINDKLLNKKFIGNASEACFSIQQHINHVEIRLQKLLNHSIADLRLSSTLFEIKKEFLKVKNKILKKASLKKIDIKKTISEDQIIISPSDFGFHNVVVKQNEELVFLDFEYSGLDDPAKLVGDYFAQVSIPVDISYVDVFIKKLCSRSIPLDEVRERSLMLLNLYKIKWCCIVLNIFIPSDMERRIFANPDLDVSLYKEKQLSLANDLINKVKNGIY
jgi:thiamine kinase-like enzyme